MPRKSSVKPRACKKLWEGHTPDTAPENAPLPYQLPASFPAHILDEEQLEEVEAWWAEWAEGVISGIREALTCARTRSTDPAGAPPVSLENFTVHAVVLAHLLRLHPSTEEGLPALAKSMGVSQRRLYYAKDIILEQLGKGAVEAVRKNKPKREATLEQLRKWAALDVAGAVKTGPRTWLVPLAVYTTNTARFALMQRLVREPGIASVADDLTEDDRHALKITLK